MSLHASPNPGMSFESMSTEVLARHVAIRFAWHKTSTHVVHDVPAVGWDWGWYSRELEPGIAIEPMSKHRGLGCVYLESPGGRPTFKAAGGIPDNVLAELRPIVEANRPRIETAWITTMAYKGWLHIEWDRALRYRIKIVAYSGTPNERRRELPCHWREIIGDRIPAHTDIAMDRASALLILGAEELNPLKVQLAPVLWPRKLDLPIQTPLPIDPRDLLKRVCQRLSTDFEP